MSKILERPKFLSRFPPGQAMLLAIVFLSIIATASMALLDYTTSVSFAQRKAGGARLTLQIAQAGLDKAVWCLNQTSGANCGGTYGTNFQGENHVILAPGEFETAITSIDASTKEISSTGFIPNSTNPLFKQTIRARAAISTTSANFSFGLQAGDGGMAMGNTARVEGSVYSNGNLEGENEAAITGDAYVASGVAAAANQEWTETNSDFIFGQGSPQTDVAQSFMPSISANINKISLYIKKTGVPSNLPVKIVSDNGQNQPSKTSLGSGTLSAGLVTASYGWVDVSLDNPLPVNAGTRYWLLLDSSNNADNFWSLAIDAPGGYSNGKGMYSPNWSNGAAAWSEVGGDFNFKIWMGEVISKLKNIDVGGDAHANTIEDSSIGGDAYYQSLINSTVGGALYPGSPDPAAAVFPISQGQIVQWKNDAAAGGTITGNFQPAQGENVSLGPKRITGNLILDDSQTLEVTGTIYVEGNVDIGNKGSIRLSPLYGASSGIIISDGWMHFENNGTFSGADPGSYLMLASIAAGGGHHDSAMDLHNNVTGVLLYASNGLVNLHNNVQTTQITAKQINLSNGCILTYEIGLANVTFSAGPAGSWQFLPGTWRITN